MNEYTTLPWKVDGHDIESESALECIAVVLNHDNWKANAEIIVEAVNNYDAIRAELETVKAQRDALIEPHIIISVFGKDKDECIVDLCQNIDFKTVQGVMAGIDVFINECVSFDDMPGGAIAKRYKLKNIHYESAQIGNYPPPNVEVPEYWVFNWEFIGYETIKQEQDA